MASRFFTPPKLKPLGLQLRHLRGGGSAPAQYYGETLDGRDVYCRYRGGQLSVHVGRVPEVDALEDGQVLLKETIGPPLDGTLSAKQLCALAGMSVSGGVDQAPLRGDDLDLSGATTFWSAWLPCTTPHARRVLAKLRTDLPVEFVQVSWWEQGAGHQTRRLNAEELPDKTFLDVSCRGCDPIKVIFTGFERDLLGYGGRETERLLKLTGRPLVQAGERGVGLLFDNLSILAQFGTDDTSQREIIRRLDRLISEMFPVVSYQAIEVASGKVEPGAEVDYVEDPAIAEWIREDPVRIRFLKRGNPPGHDDPRFLMLRPV